LDIIITQKSSPGVQKLANYNIHFILGSDGPFFSKIKKESSELNNISLTGWLAEPEISYILSFSHIGVVPANVPVEAFPNKVFVYLSAGIPIISSMMEELREITEGYQIGFYYPPGDAMEPLMIEFFIKRASPLQKQVIMLFCLFLIHIAKS
jgi:glycosyltransferase involved in cell wall biosynthesis